MSEPRGELEEVAGVKEEEKETLPTADEESALTVETEAIMSSAEETPIYDVSKPELLEVMVTASEILEKAASGMITIEDAKKLYVKAVLEQMKKFVGEGVIVKIKKRKKKAKERTKKREKKTKKQGKKTKKEKAG
ncbi:MAG: hypothetical protein QXN05_01650 [Acidilobaceae archaeon]